MSLAAGRDRQALPDAPRPAGVRRAVFGRQPVDSRWREVREIDRPANVHLVRGEPALAARGELLLPGLRRRAAAGAGGLGACRQRRVVAGTRAHPSHLRRARATATVTTGARSIP